MYEFGPFRMDPQEQVLSRDGKAIPLSPKLFDTLLALVRNSGHLLDKDEMLRQVWPDSFVEEGNLTKNIFLLRKILEDGQDVSYIETVPKRGYRFVAEVKTVQGNGSGLLVGEALDQKSKAIDSVELGPGPEDNYPKKQTPSLSRWLIVAGAVLCIGIGTYLLVQRQATTKHPEIKSIAVLPLQNLSGDPAQEYFADGMTETLIGNLAQIRALRVISRTSVMSFKESKRPLPPLPEIARQLKVDGVIEGSVQRENGRVKLTIQLVHGPTDTHLWASNYERALTDVLKVQDEMARAIADEIRIQITPEDRARLSSAPTVNPAAHEAYLLGRFHFWKFIAEDHQRAIEHFERAIQIDPNYAPAYAGLSMAWQMLRLQRGGVKGADSQARAAVQRALELNDRLAEAYVAQGHLQLFHDWDWNGAENSMRRALELDPNNLDAHFNYALVHLAVGRFPRAIAEIQAAEQLDPLSHQVQIIFGRILLHAGKHEEALPRVKQAIEREPRSSNAHVRLAEIYEAMGRYTEALETYEKAEALRGSARGHRALAPVVARINARMGKSGEAKRLLQELSEPSQASVYAALGDNDEAFRVLFKTVEKRDTSNVFIATDPRFASLHSDPRWKELRRRMNFPE